MHLIVKKKCVQMQKKKLFQASFKLKIILYFWGAKYQLDLFLTVSIRLMQILCRFVH